MDKCITQSKITLDTLNRVIRILKLFLLVCFLAMCVDDKMKKEYENLELDAKRFREQKCSDHRIYNITHGDRFGTFVIAINCISKKDCDELKGEFGEFYKNWSLYYMSPVWPRGEILPEFKEEIEVVENLPNSNVYGTEAFERRSKLYDDLYHQEELAWHSFSTEKQKMLLKKFIKFHLDRDENFANCGKKFLG